MKTFIAAVAACLLLFSTVTLANPDAAGDIAVPQAERQLDSANSETPPSAEKSQRSRALGNNEKSPNGSYVLQLIASLVVVLVAFAVLAWLVKRFNRLPGRSGNHMQVLAAMSLGARERAVLVQVGTTQMLLGVSPGRVATLHVFDEPVVDVEEGSASGVNFGAILSNLGKGGRS